MDRKKHPPQLRFDSELDRWVMALQGVLSPDGESYCMIINVSWDGEGWFKYRFARYDMGDLIELVTSDEFDERVKDITEHEGEEVAKIWVEEQEQVEVIHDNHPVFELRAHWEAMMTLGLFFPHVTMREWQGTPLSQETRAKMDAAREKWMREGMEVDGLHDEADRQVADYNAGGDQLTPPSPDWGEHEDKKRAEAEEDLSLGHMDPRAWASEGAPAPSVGVVDSLEQEKWARAHAHVVDEPQKEVVPSDPEDDYSDRAEWKGRRS
jgi:hypothetical protein